MEEKAVKDTGKHVSEAGRRPERLNKAAGKRKARELADVWIGRDLEKPVERKSRKVSFYLGEYTEEASCSDRVSRFGESSFVFLFERMAFGFG